MGLPTVCQSVTPSVCQSVSPSVRQYSPLSNIDDCCDAHERERSYPSPSPGDDIDDIGYCGELSNCCFSFDDPDPVSLGDGLPSTSLASSLYCADDDVSLDSSGNIVRLLSSTSIGGYLSKSPGQIDCDCVVTLDPLIDGSCASLCDISEFVVNFIIGGGASCWSTRLPPWQ